MYVLVAHRLAVVCINGVEDGMRDQMRSRRGTRARERMIVRTGILGECKPTSGEWIAVNKGNITSRISTQQENGIASGEHKDPSRTQDTNLVRATRLLRRLRASRPSCPHVRRPRTRMKGTDLLLSLRVLSSVTSSLCLLPARARALTLSVLRYL